MTSEAGDDLAAVLGAAARSLQAENGLDQTLDAIVRSAADTIPGAVHAGISLVRRRKGIETVAQTGELVLHVDQAQYECGEGPCMDAAWTHDIFCVDDLADDQRWPEFSRRAVELGVRSMLSFQLYVTGDNLGVLNLYAHQPAAFDHEAEHIGRLFAAHAAVALAGSQREHQLTQALTSRDLIGQAKGILMERNQVPAEHAFAMLVEASQHTNMKLRDIAEYLVQDTENKIAARHGARPA
jgi:GAF domain-containing protein